MRRAGCRARSTAEGVGVVLLARVELQGQVVAEAVGHVLAGPARVHAPQFAAILEDRPIAVEALVFVDRIPLCDPAGQAPVVPASTASAAESLAAFAESTNSL